MKVLVVHWGRNGGGPRFASDAVAGLKAAGVATTYSYSLQSERAAMDHDLADSAFPVNTFSTGRQAVLGAPRALRLAHRLRAFAIEQRVDCVFAAMEQIWQPAAAHAFAHTAIPYLLGVHDGQFHAGDGWRLGAATRRMEVHASDGLLTFSNAVTAEIGRSWDYPRPRIWQTFLPVRASVGPVARYASAVRVAFFGRWQPYKGLPMLVDAARILQQRGVDCTVDIYGDGEEAVLERDDLPINVQVHRGWVAEHEVETLLQQVDVLVAPYLEASQSGVVPLAAALGVPSVVTPVGGLVEQVSHGRTGLIAARVDAEALADAVGDLVANTDRRRSFGSAAAADVAERRSAAHFGESAAQAIAELIASGKRHR